MYSFEKLGSKNSKVTQKLHRTKELQVTFTYRLSRGGRNMG